MLSQSSPAGLWRKRIVSTLAAALSLAGLTVLARAEWESQSFRRAVQKATSQERGTLRILSDQAFTDSAGYSGNVRQSAVLVVVGTEDEIRDFHQRLRESLPALYDLSASLPSTFTESHRRGFEDPEACEVIHITAMRALEWYDYGQWMD